MFLREIEFEFEYWIRILRDAKCSEEGQLRCLSAAFKWASATFCQLDQVEFFTDWIRKAVVVCPEKGKIDSIGPHGFHASLHSRQTLKNARML